MLAAAQGVALIAASGCATGSGYSIATTAPQFSDQQSFDEVQDEDGRGRRWRRFFIRRGEGGLVETADTGGSDVGLGGPRLSDTNGTGGLRYLIGNLTPQLGQLDGTVAGLTGQATGIAGGLTTAALGAVNALPGGAMAQTLVGGGQNTANLALASLTVQGNGLTGLTSSGATSTGATVGVGGTSVSVGVGAGAGSTPGSGLTGGGVSVGVGGLPTGNLPTTPVTSAVLPVVGTSLGGITGGGVAVGLGLGGGGSGGLPGLTTTTTNTGPGLLGR